ncbi:MAG: glyceraldehyde 3-phosphate dehydrogenase NAD-binding domain-containing protein [Patescibacteria group bacterium]
MNENETKKIRVAINGFGRIGRVFLKLLLEKEKFLTQDSLGLKKEIEIVAINDLSEIENLAYLLKYDTANVLKNTDLDLEIIKSEKEKKIRIGKMEILFLSEPDPNYLPWKDLDIDVVLEATGVFNSYQKASAHLQAGAKRVVLTAPAKGDKSGVAIPDYGVIGKTILMGINEDDLKTCQISANGSCTTNAVSPVLQILKQKIGIKKAILNTIHSYTATQKIIDSPDKKDFRKGRAGAQNIIPTSTGAAIATTLAIKDLVGKFDGMAVRVPVILGSLVDLTFVTDRNTTEEEINQILIDASKEKKWKNIFGVTNEPIVSSDVIGNKFASLVDLSLTKVVDRDLVKVLIWYDNETGYANTLIEHILKAF